MNPSSPAVREAEALTARLYRAWESVPHNTSYADRLVSATERAHQRQLRRAAQAGDQRAQHWITSRQAALARLSQPGK